MPEGRKLVDVSEWKAAAESARADLGVFKFSTFGAEPLDNEIAKELETQERVLQWVISDEGRDRDGDRITQSGWDLDHYKQNPVVLWAHNYSQPPIGKSLRVWVGASTDGGPRLRAIKQFTPRDVNPFGFMIYELSRDKYLRAASVGFLPSEYEQDTKQAGESDSAKVGFKFLKQSLLESSVVPVPSNPRALEGAKSVHRIDLTPYIAWAESILDTEKGDGLWVPRKTIEELHAIVRAPKAWSIPSAPTVVHRFTVTTALPTTGDTVTTTAPYQLPTTMPGLPPGEPSLHTGDERAKDERSTPATAAAPRPGSTKIAVGSPQDCLDALNAAADFLLGFPELAPAELVRIDNAIGLATKAIGLIVTQGAGEPDADESMPMGAGLEAPNTTDPIVLAIEDDAGPDTTDGGEVIYVLDFEALTAAQGVGA